MNVNLRWTPSTALDLDHYEVHYGRLSGVYTSSVIPPTTETIVTIEGLRDGVPWFFAVKAVDVSGNESSFSGEVSKINKFVRIR